MTHTSQNPEFSHDLGRMVFCVSSAIVPHVMGGSKKASSSLFPSGFDAKQLILEVDNGFESQFCYLTSQMIRAKRLSFFICDRKMTTGTTQTQLC